MELVEILVVLLGASAVLALVGQRLHVPYAVILVLGGMALALVPGLPREELQLDPGLALALFLPPLLQLSAHRTDWRAFRGALWPILMLAVGAVLFTAVVVAVTAKALVPDLPWGAAIALGAIVAPPDAVAAAAVLRETRIPKRLVTVLEGESLLNDASALVLYRFAVAATLAGTIDFDEAAWSFLAAAVGGAAVGWAIGWLAVKAFARLENSLLETTLSILTGFAAYFAAEHLHFSGVLGAVASGLVIGRKQHRVFSARVRLESNAVWSFVEFLVTSFVFILIGLQLRGVVERLSRYDPGELALLAGAVSAVLIISRFVWVFPTEWAPRALSPRLRARNPAPPAGHLTVVSWAGMRGVVSLAAALALPVGFPGRDVIVFLAFCAILATLVLQGTTLGPLIRWLRVTETTEADVEAQEAALRRKLAAAELDAILDRLPDPENREAARQLLPEYRDRALYAARLERDAEVEVERRETRRRLRLEALQASRRLLGEHQQRLDAERLRVLEEELDHREAQLRRAVHEGS